MDEVYSYRSKENTVAQNLVWKPHDDNTCGAVSSSTTYNRVKFEGIVTEWIYYTYYYLRLGEEVGGGAIADDGNRVILVIVSNILVASHFILTILRCILRSEDPLILLRFIQTVEHSYENKKPIRHYVNHL